MLYLKGERHTGTNFLQSLLLHYFRERTTRIMHYHFYEGCNASRQPNVNGMDDLYFCCSKHGTPHPGCSYMPPAVYVLLLRDPYSWLSANYFMPYGGCQDETRYSTRRSFAENRGNFSLWLRRPAATYGACRPWRLRPTPMAVWVELARAYHQVRKWAPSVLLRNDEVLNEEVLLNVKLPQIEVLLQGMRSGSSGSGNDNSTTAAAPAGATPRRFVLPQTLPPVRARQKQWTPASYRKEVRKLHAKPWRRMFTADDLAFVNAQLPVEAMRGFVREHESRGPR